MEPRSLDSPPTEEAQPGEDESNLRDEERAFAPRDRPSSISLPSADRDNTTGEGDETERQTRPSSIYSSTAYIRKQTARLLEAINPSATRLDGPVPPKLQELVNAFKNSEISQALNAEILEASAAPATEGNGTTELPDVAVESSISRGRKRASWATQFRILSGRAFKNLYRDPALLAAHYISSIAIAGGSNCRCSLKSWSCAHSMLQLFADSSSRTFRTTSRASRTDWACSSLRWRSSASRVCLA